MSARDGPRLSHLAAARARARRRGRARRALRRGRRRGPRPARARAARPGRSRFCRRRRSSSRRCSSSRCTPARSTWHALLAPTFLPGPAAAAAARARRVRRSAPAAARRPSASAARSRSRDTLPRLRPARHRSARRAPLRARAVVAGCSSRGPPWPRRELMPSTSDEGEDMRHRIALGALVALAALTFTASAFAHARVSPPVARRQGAAGVHARRPDREGERDDDDDRADTAGRLLDRLVRSVARVEAQRAADRLRRRPPSSRR